jgi:hypothetical protein
MVPAREIAIIGGTGNQGFGLALRWAKASQRILIGSRDRAKAQAAAERVKGTAGTNAQVEGLENAEATAKTNLVVLTVPFAAQVKILKSLRESFEPNAILMDVTVPLEIALGGRATRVLGVWAGSAAEQAVELVPKTVRVVSAFHNVSAVVLQDLKHAVDCDVIVCGDDPEAKQVVRSLIEYLPGAGYVDGGPIENSRTVEAMTALLASINIRYKTQRAGIRITGLPPVSG